MKNVIRYIVVGGLALGACAPLGQDNETGEGSLMGHAVLMRGGHPRACDDVTLARRDETTAKRMAALPIGINGFVRAPDFRKVEIDNAYARVSRSVTCSQDGKFALNNLPQGQYFLVARLTWLLGHALHGGFVVRTVSVSQVSQTIDISVSESY